PAARTARSAASWFSRNRSRSRRASRSTSRRRRSTSSPVSRDRPSRSPNRSRSTGAGSSSAPRSSGFERDKGRYRRYPAQTGAGITLAPTCSGGVAGASDDRIGAALAHGRDRQRRVDAEARRDDRAVDAVEPFVAVDAAGVVDDPELGGLGHPAAAERVRAVDALGLGQRHEAAESAVLGDAPDRVVGGGTDRE